MIVTLYSLMPSLTEVKSSACSNIEFKIPFILRNSYIFTLEIYIIIGEKIGPVTRI